MILSRLVSRINKYLFSTEVIGLTHQLVKNESIDAVIHFLKKNYKFFRPASVKFLLNFYHHLSNTNSQITLEKNTRLIIHLSCWGKPYCEKVKKYLLPSLLSDGNLPTIVKKHKTILLIDCDIETKNELSASRIVEAIKEFADIKFLVMPEKLLNSYNACTRYPDLPFFKALIQANSNLKYTFLGGLQTQALEIAMKNKCYISFLMPDFVISDDFLTKAFLNIRDKKVVLATGFRTDYQKVENSLNRFYRDKENTQLSLPAKTLTEFKIKYMHDAAKRRVIAPSTINYDPCAQLIFETQNGFIVRTFHLHPILLDCKHYHYQIETDYYPIDNTILDQMLSKNQSYQQQAYICDDASKISFMELSDTDMYAPPSDKSVGLNYQELVKRIGLMISSAPSAYDSPLNRYFRSTKIKFESSEICKTGNFITDDTFFSDLEKHLELSQTDFR